MEEIEMYEEDDPIEVGLLVDRFGLVSALPEVPGALPFLISMKMPR
jgi:hypothetical protein